MLRNLRGMAMNRSEVAEVRDMLRKLIALQNAVDPRLHGALEIAIAGLDTLLKVNEVYKTLELARK
jgi:hypothetical protein